MGLRSWFRQLRQRTKARDADTDYQQRLASELEHFEQCTKVHDLPDIFHYWSNKYLVARLKPFGFTSALEFFGQYLGRICASSPEIHNRFVSIGAGNCEFDLEIVKRLVQEGKKNFSLDCIDINPTMLERGESAAEQQGIADNMSFVTCDINSWTPNRKYQAVLAIQCLHHFVELELLFDRVAELLEDDGYFLTDDMIGRNGHMRWPEALEIVNELWNELPDRYKYNHQLKRLEKQFVNWDCSTEGFEGIRSQDILPLLIERFHFELFFGYGNLVDPFIDRSFGHNFDPNNPKDLEFIDRVHELDQRLIDEGRIKPTHMIAAMKVQPIHQRVDRHLTPEFCVRRS